MDRFVKTPEVYGFETLYRELGYYISRLEEYENSLKFFDEALKKTPNDKRALIGRSRARAKVSQYEGALQDINNALGLDADDLVVLADKALNTYLCCEFEEGLLQNSRLVPKRQKPDNFAMGIMQCSDAIENCLGERSGKPLRDHFKIIRKLAWKKNYAAHKPFEPKPTNKPKKKKMYLLKKINRDEEEREPVQPKRLKSKKYMCSESAINDDNSIEAQIKDSLHSTDPDDEPVPPFLKPFPFKPLQNHTSNIENYMAEKYLDAMYLDKIFLKKLQSDPGAKCPNREGSLKIKQLARNCYKAVSYKQELLRTHRPFYFIKYQEATVSGALKARQRLELEHQQQNTRIEAEVMLSKMTDAYNRKDLKMLLMEVEKLRRFCENKPKKLLPDKHVYMDEVYDKVCKGWYDIYRVNNNQSLFEQQKRIYGIFGLALSREPSTDSVINQFKNVFVDYKKEILDVEKRLQNAIIPEEICWLYHELSRYQFEMKKFNLSRVYARKCIHQSKAIDNLYWIFNGTMLMIKCNLAEHDKNDSKNDLLNAIEYVKVLNDEGKIDFLKKCIDVVDVLEFENIYGKKQLEKRENNIIQMMATSKMKDEVAHLFRQMSAMPASRRMVVIPGVRAEDKSESKSMKGKSMSIMPGAHFSETEVRDTASKKQHYDPNIRMMDLIELHV